MRNILHDLGINNFIAASPQMYNLLEKIKTVSVSCSNVLITGESGVGKEEVAKLLHTFSNRAHNPFVPVNCTSIPAELIESELFGHTKGAFTGALKDKKGLFEIANEGTLFLDEIGDLDFHLQAKLLRALQNKEIRPIGSNCTVPVNIRIVSATHRDLGEYVRLGKFREDLFYRLNVVPILVPALREHLEDLPMLVNHFLVRLAKEHNTSQYTINDSAINVLTRHTWPGNIRELQNVMERSALFSEGNEITAQNILGAIEPLSPIANDPWRCLSKEKPTLAELEECYIKSILKEVDYNKGKASRILGISRRTLCRKEEYYRAHSTLCSNENNPIYPSHPRSGIEYARKNINKGLNV